MHVFVVAKVIVANEKGEILVLRRSQTDDRRPGEWDFPGGWVEQDEDFLAAVKREATEEAGIELQDPQLIFALSETTNHGHGTWLFFMDRTASQPDIKLSYEHDLSAWKKLEDLLQEVKYERQIKPLRYIADNHLLDGDSPSQ